MKNQTSLAKCFLKRMGNVLHSRSQSVHASLAIIASSSSFRWISCDAATVLFSDLIHPAHDRDVCAIYGAGRRVQFLISRRRRRGASAGANCVLTDVSGRISVTSSGG